MASQLERVALPGGTVPGRVLLRRVSSLCVHQLETEEFSSGVLERALEVIA